MNKIISISAAAGLAMTIVFCNFIGFEKNYEDLQSDVLRMHIIANSDSTQDQNLKLAVRDRLLQSSEEIFGDCSSISEAEINVSENLELIEEISKEVINENGYDYTVKAELVNMEFDTRTYENFTMPSGTYDAVRVTIGQAEGQNWWCVMYPPLCIPASSDCSDYFSEGEYDIITRPEKYQVKLKCVEIYKKITGQI